MSKQFNLILLVRFTGYTVFLYGLLAILMVFGPIAQAEFGYRKDKVLGVERTVADVVAPSVGSEPGSSVSPGLNFGDINSQKDIITPVDTDFGLVIPKINANTKVIANVDPTNERAYTNALTKGVAHAAGTNVPGEVGNIYLFSHSTDAPWNVIRYNAIFYLLREVETGDEIVVFYNKRRYNYVVFDKQTVEANDVSFLTNRYDQQVLTLQTCDPPGTLLNRLIVRAKLAGS